jgi:RNase P subunit RPR2
MASPLSEPMPVFIGRLICDKCGRTIHQGGTWYEVKNKRLRKRGLDVVCHCCAEGIIKEWESEVK